MVIRSRSAPLWTSRVAALAAVALLLFAGVKSAVMQVQMAGGGSARADCGMTRAEMAGMGAMAPDPFAATPAKAPSKPVKSGGDVCGFCADAAHAPLTAYAEPLRPPLAVAFVATPRALPLGARAPPLIVPKARGPPQGLLSA